MNTLLVLPPIYGSVYITTEDHIVQKFSRCGELVKAVGKKGLNAGEFDCIRYHNHKVYVCDSGNGRVQVFDCNLNFISSFVTHGDGPGRLKKPRDIDFDAQGNAYVVDYEKHQVLVFSDDGQYLHHFGQRGRDHGELNGPRGLCVSGDCVYVVEHWNDRISVHLVSGQFVHSFGRRGTEGGEFRYPCGIDIDKDGFVFVMLLTIAYKYFRLQVCVNCICHLNYKC